MCKEGSGWGRECKTERRAGILFRLRVQQLLMQVWSSEGGWLFSRQSKPHHFPGVPNLNIYHLMQLSACFWTKSTWSASCWKCPSERGRCLIFMPCFKSVEHTGHEGRKQLQEKQRKESQVQHLLRSVPNTHQRSTNRLKSSCFSYIIQAQSEHVTALRRRGFSYADSVSDLSHLSFKPAITPPHYQDNLSAAVLKAFISRGGQTPKTELLSLPFYERDSAHYSSSQWRKRLQIWHLHFPWLQNQPLKTAAPTPRICLVFLCQHPIPVLLPSPLFVSSEGQAAPTRT